MTNLENAIACLDNIEEESKRKIKLALLQSAADNPVLKAFFYYAYDWQITFGLVYKPLDLPKAKTVFGPRYNVSEEWDVFLQLLDELATRKLTGLTAVETIHRFMKAVPPSRAKWYARVINGDLKCGTNVATFGEVWPDLRSQFAVSLADKVTSDTEHAYPVAVEPKLDGIRITNVFKSGQGAGKTRSGAEYNPVLQHILKEQAPQVQNGAVDGELLADWAPTGKLTCYGGKRYKSPWGKTSAMLKTGTYRGVFDPDRLTPEMWNEIERDLKFHAFDYISLDVYDPDICLDKRPFHERRANLVELVGKLGPDAHTKLVHQEIANNQEELDVSHSKFMQQGYEGSMIKDLQSPYIPARTAVMLKRKEDEFIDGVIIDVEESKINPGFASAYRVRLDNGEITGCTVQTHDNKVQHLLRKEELKGCRIEMTRQKDAIAVTDGARFAVYTRIRFDLPKEAV